MSDREPNLVVVSGPSGAGKSTVLARALAEMDRLQFSISHTTRPPRPGEKDAVEEEWTPDYDDATYDQLFDSPPPPPAQAPAPGTDPFAEDESLWQEKIQKEDDLIPVEEAPSVKPQ